MSSASSLISPGDVSLPDEASRLKSGFGFKKGHKTTWTLQDMLRLAEGEGGGGGDSWMRLKRSGNLPLTTCRGRWLTMRVCPGIFPLATSFLVVSWRISYPSATSFATEQDHPRLFAKRSLHYVMHMYIPKSQIGHQHLNETTTTKITGLCGPIFLFHIHRTMRLLSLRNVGHM